MSTENLQLRVLSIFGQMISVTDTKGNLQPPLHTKGCVSERYCEDMAKIHTFLLFKGLASNSGSGTTANRNPNVAIVS